MTEVIWEEAPPGVVRPDDGPIFPVDEPAAEPDYPSAKFSFPKGEESTLAAAREMLGWDATAKQLAAIAGAPDDAEKVVISVYDASKSRQLEVEVRSPTVTMTRIVERPHDSAGRARSIYNFFFEVEKAVAGKGLGTDIFAAQVRAAARRGFTTIVARAERDDPEGMVGYYVWPRLGYDAAIPGDVAGDLPPTLAAARKISDLMKSEEGRAFWKRHGKTTEMTFDLTPGSLSRRALESYVKERAARVG